MRIPSISQLGQVIKDSGQGMSIGAAAGGLAGLLLGFTHSFNRRRRPGKAALVSGIGAITGSAIGTIVWRLPDQFAHNNSTGQETVALSSEPAHWPIFQEQEIELTETAEHLTVDKQTRQIEEVVIRPVVTEHVAPIQDNLRHTEIDIQHEAGHVRDSADNDDVVQKERDFHR